MESVHFFAATAHCSDDSNCTEDGCCTNTVSIEQWHFDATVHYAAQLSNNVLNYILPIAALQLLNLACDAQNTSTVSVIDAPRRPPPLLMSMRC